MRSAFLSRFTPSLMPPEALEFIFVQREREAQRTVELVRESVLTANKSHTLFVGPRGIGKTHLVSLIYHRLRGLEELKDRLLIAWLREEEWGVSSFLDVLLRILRALSEDDPSLETRVAAVSDTTTQAAAERTAQDLLRQIVGDRTLLLLAENLDDLFDGIGDEGQKRFRAFLQDTRFSSILATSQGLFGGVSRQTSPFYNFFRVQHLPGLSLDEAVLLLTKIAQLEEDASLTSFLQTPAGRARVRAVHHLAGGNPRVYVTFSEFLTREALDELVAPFLKMLDELTPYYQSKMRSLSAQQRKIVEILTDARGAVPVKEIAQRSFSSHQTISSQLKELREKGYVRSHSVGRESFYELQEPLMRLCLEVKKQRGEPIKLFVEFLRLWCTREDLERRLSLLPPGAMLTEKHLREALRLAESDDNPLIVACIKDLKTFADEENYEKELQVVEELIAIQDNATAWQLKGLLLNELARYEEALTAYNQVLALDANNIPSWEGKGRALGSMQRHEEALTALEQALKLDPRNAWVCRVKGLTLYQLGRYQEALTVVEQALTLDAEDDKSWWLKGEILNRLERFEEAMLASEQALMLDSNNAGAWYAKGVALQFLGRYESALTAYEQSSAHGWKDNRLWPNKSYTLVQLERYEEALESLDHAMQTCANDLDLYILRMDILLTMERWGEASSFFEDVRTKFPNKPEALTTLSSGVLRWLLLGDEDQWSSQVEKLIKLYGPAMNEVLGQALTATIADVNSPDISPAVRLLWWETWQKATGETAEMRLPLRLLDAAIRYYDSGTPPDPRILLELPVEERSILEALLGVSQE